jgi:hypothetical protein
MARIRGVRGVNHLDFLGRLGRRLVRPGVYVLSLKRAASGRPVGQPLLVQVVSSRRAILLRDARRLRAACDGSAALVPSSLAGFLSPQQTASPTTATPAAKKPSPPPSGTGSVLGVDVQLPAFLALDDPWVLTAVLLSIGLSLIAVVVYGVRYLRER